MTFEDYLEDVHAKEYHGTDDDMPDAFETWISTLDTSEVIEYAEACIKDMQDPEKDFGTPETWKEQYERNRNK